MRRISVLLALAAVLLSGAVAYTLKLRIAQARKARVAPAPQIAVGYEAKSPDGWTENKDDPQTGKPIVRLRADSAEATHDPSTLEIHGLALRLYDKSASSYTYVRCEKGLFDERSGLLKSQGPVSIVMNVPADKDAANEDEADKRVRVTTTGVTYETKTGKASTDQPASFVFTKGDGQGVGADYDPNTKVLHLKSKIALDWIGDGPPEKKMHIETDDLVYKESEQKIYLSPSAKMQRQSTTIQAQNPIVILQDGRLHQIQGDHAFGTDAREGRTTSYSADKMTALFDEDGNLVNIIGENNARVMARESGSQTTLTGNRADLRFAVSAKQVAGKEQDESNLHLVLADGHAVAESVPQPQPGVELAETRILRSEHIELEMKPDGKDVQEIRTASQAQLEFKPNRPEQSHRLIDCSRLRIVYGEGSYIDTFLAWNVATHTDKPASAAHARTAQSQDGTPAGPPAPALTWSDQLTAKFTPNTNKVATIEQVGKFRYEEGVRKAWAKRAFLEQTINRMTLTGTARVLDDTGSAVGDEIVMNQANGDMDAKGHVVSTHMPDKNQKPGTSMLDATKSMQAQADEMQTRENNTKIRYEGNAVIWQGADRIAANYIDIDRNEQSLHAVGDIVSESVDNKSNDDSQSLNSSTQAKAQNDPPIFTIVRAPELFYRDDTRVAHYTGGVKLTREKLTLTSKELSAYLTPSDAKKSDQSSLDHAFADGDVTIFDQVAPNRTRTGIAKHCEYYTKENKVILNGGAPQMVDSVKGITKGRQLTYYDDDDRLVVEGEKKDLAFTQMKKK
jgi:lipopolysaccharide export system protein LptA